MYTNSPNNVGYILSPESVKTETRKSAVSDFLPKAGDILSSTNTMGICRRSNPQQKWVEADPVFDHLMNVSDVLY